MKKLNIDRLWKAGFLLKNDRKYPDVYHNFNPKSYARKYKHNYFFLEILEYTS